MNDSFPFFLTINLQHLCRIHVYMYEMHVCMIVSKLNQPLHYKLCIPADGTNLYSDREASRYSITYLPAPWQFQLQVRRVPDLRRRSFRRRSFRSRLTVSRTAQPGSSIRSFAYRPLCRRNWLWIPPLIAHRHRWEQWRPHSSRVWCLPQLPLPRASSHQGLRRRKRSPLARLRRAAGRRHPRRIHRGRTRFRPGSDRPGRNHDRERNMQKQDQALEKKMMYIMPSKYSVHRIVLSEQQFYHYCHYRFLPRTA